MFKCLVVVVVVVHFLHLRCHVKLNLIHSYYHHFSIIYKDFVTHKTETYILATASQTNDILKLNQAIILKLYLTI